MLNFFKRLFRMRGSIPVEKFTVDQIATSSFTCDDLYAALQKNQKNLDAFEEANPGLVVRLGNSAFIGFDNFRVGKLQGVIR